MTTHFPNASHVSYLVTALCFGALQLSAAATSADPVPATTLEPSAPVERELVAGETHAFEVVVPPDHVVIGTVEQRGIDVIVRLVDPSGKAIATIDSPNGVMGPEPWTIQPKPPGAWRIEVAPFVAGASGRYEARIDETVTTALYAERQAKLRFRSPRMFELWKEYRNGRGAIDSFAKGMEGHAPLVEPIAGDPRGDVLVTFLWKDDSNSHYVSLQGGPIGGEPEHPMLRFEDTNLWYLTLRAPKDLRVSYAFRTGQPLDAGASLAEQDSTYGMATPDPWNNRRSVSSLRSVVELPGAPAQPWVARNEHVPAGRVVMETLHSKILGEDRKVALYLPPGFETAHGPYPFVIVLDGESYATVIPTPVILDNLIAARKIPPTLGVLVANQGMRARDLSMSEPFCDFLSQELAPWLRKEHGASTAPGRATIAGSSLGGLAAAFCALRHPDVFGNVLSQSGAFWFSPGAMDTDALYSIETGALMTEVINAPRKPLRFWMEVGLFELNLAQNRHMRDVLLLKGSEVSYHEYAGGHDYSSWRGSLADGLIFLAGRPVAPITTP